MSCAPEVIVQQQPDNKSSVLGLGGITRRFSFSIKKSKLNQRFSLKTASSKKDERRYSSCSTSSLSTVNSLNSSLNIDEERRVRFATKDRRGKKIKAEVIEFEKVRTKEASDCWTSEMDMAGTLEDVRKVVHHFTKNCSRYVHTMNEVADRCELASAEDESVSDKFDSRVIKQLAQSDARGLEHLVAPRLDNSRKMVVESVIRTQKALSKASPEKREKLLAQKYSQMSHSSKLLARTIAEGDALVEETAQKKKC